MRRLAELLLAPLRAADFIVAWRSARKLGGAIRYRINGNDDDGDDDNNFDNTPPLASPASDGEECLERAEANQDGGGVF